MRKTRIGIVGYGNIGRGVEKAVNAAEDMELVAIFTRRSPESLKNVNEGVRFVHIDHALVMKDDIDVMILCGGSATDLPEQGPKFAEFFNTVDSFDTHARIPEYLESINSVAKNTTSIISVGWDPGLFSMMRILSNAILPDGNDYTFWGKGVSQGHSDAIRRVNGVKNGIQYTIPVSSAVNSVRNGENPALTARQKHTRECFVVAENGVDRAQIEKDIKEMPNYFSDYDTTVTFITEEELKNNHSKMPHGGMVMRSGHTGDNSHVIEFSLKLDSNPEFTASVLVAYARAAQKLSHEKSYGAKTVFDIPLTYLCAQDRNSLIKHML